MQLHFVLHVSQRVIRCPVAPIRNFSLNPINEAAESVTTIVESFQKSRDLVKSNASFLKDYAKRATSQVRIVFVFLRFRPF